MLTAKGLIASRPRHGTSVSPESEWNFLDPDVLRWLLGRGFSLDLLADFIAFRGAIEPQAALLAIGRNDRASLQRIGSAIEHMERANHGDREATLAADIETHRAIVEAILAGDAQRAVVASQNLLNEAAMLIERVRQAAR